MNKRDKIVDVMDTRKTMETIFQAFGQITTFVSAIGGISMMVAGVSILNIMMMSVTERIKEIGIMRSIGAQRKEVMSMFLYEAADPRSCRKRHRGYHEPPRGICNKQPDAADHKVPVRLFKSDPHCLWHVIWHL